MADGLTKPLGRQPFYRFIDLIGMESPKERLEAIRREDELASDQTMSTIAFMAHSETWDAREIRSAVYDFE